jgi:hypothetical protein
MATLSIVFLKPLGWFLAYVDIIGIVNKMWINDFSSLIIVIVVQVTE